MSGDYTRFTFDPAKRFAGVQMQQGRVQLDSDWNEQLEILRERNRLLTLDTGGPAWLSYLTSPNAFLVTALAGPPADLGLGEGRIYVDGRLAEILAGENVTYLNQPFLPDPDPLVPAADTIVYLDLWEREVTWAEDPDLLDVALGGVDTTTRIQQVWQVRLLDLQGVPAVCGLDLDALFPPSAGRLTTSAVAPPAPDDPCILPPNAGYRGIENRLYRVEVQRGGPLGTALFKWSRDNGSIVSRVSAIAVAGGVSRITVNRIGRDDTLRFRIDDWVTLTDDHRELHGEAGQMARIIDIDNAARVITLDRAVPSSGRAFGASAADIQARNTRLQRWDQHAPGNVLDADGLMATAAGPIELEDGVLASFSVSPAGGEFKVGDYWVFAARTATASVEELNQAPPRGIRHHYMQLAAIPAGGSPTDCRPPAPADEEGCCTVVVKPGESIQAAINSLPPAGGCVCLKVGKHGVEAPVMISQDNVTLHGESMGAVVVNPKGTGLLAIRGAELTRVHTIVFEQGEAAAEPVIAIEGARRTVIEDCVVETSARERSIGLLALGAFDLVIRATHFAHPIFGVWLDKGCGAVSVSGCEFRMPGKETDGATSVALLATSMREFVTADDNLITDAVFGIVVNDDPGGLPVSRASFSRATNNRIELIAPRGDKERGIGIDMAADRSIVASNHVIHPGGNLTAIRMGGDGSRARGNFVLSRAKETNVSLALALGHEQDDKFIALDRLTASENVIQGIQSGIGVAHVAHAEIRGNLLGGEDRPLAFGIALGTSTDCIVADNVVTRAIAGVMSISGARNSFTNNRIEGGRAGIVVGGEEAPVIAGNRVVATDKGGITALMVTQRCDVVQNHLVRCGGKSDVATAIGSLLVVGEWHVEANEIFDTGLLPDGSKGASVAYGISGQYVLEARIESNRITYADFTKRDAASEDRALRLQGWLEADYSFSESEVVLGCAAQIEGNKFEGCGQNALVELLETDATPSGTPGFKLFLRFERVLMNNNYCWHVVDANADIKKAATVSLVGRLFTVSANQVKASINGFPSWHLHGRRGPFMGNISSGEVLGRTSAQQFPAPQNAFNMIV